jgi:hypothetical protein
MTDGTVGLFTVPSRIINQERGAAMKMNKKVYIGGGVALFLLIVGGFALVSANGPWRGSGFPGCGRFASGPHGALDRADVADYFLWRLDRQAGALDLSADQQEKYDLWRDDLKAHVTQGGDARRQWMTNFRMELNKPEPNIPLLLDSLQTKIAEMSGFATQNLDFFSDLWQTLNKEQQRSILEQVRQRIDPHPMS